MKKRMMSLMLLLTLLLTACGGSAEKQQYQADSLLGMAAETDENMPLLTVDGQEVPAWKYLYWLAETCRTIEEEYAVMDMELDWNGTAEGVVLKEYAREQALEAVALYATVENWADECGCMLTEKTEAPVIFPTKWGLNEQQRNEMESAGLRYRELYRMFSEEGSALAPDAEETAAFAQTEGWLGVEEILISSSADQAAAKEQAARYFAALNAAGNVAAEFAKLSEESGGTKRACTFQLGDGTLDSALETAVSGLENGQISGILETEEGFHILRRVPPSSHVFKERFFDDVLRKAAAKAEIRCTQTYKDLDVESFYTALLEKKPNKADGTLPE